MPIEETQTHARRDITLVSPGPCGAITGWARATTFGLEFLWGNLPCEMRAKLAAGGCDRLAFQRALLAAYTVAGGRPVHLDLRETKRGVYLVTLPAGPGETETSTALVIPQFYFSFTWQGQTVSLPMKLPLAADVPDFWSHLPREARTRLAEYGMKSESVNASLWADLQLAMKRRSDETRPTIRLEIPTKRRAPLPPPRTKSAAGAAQDVAIAEHPMPAPDLPAPQLV